MRIASASSSSLITRSLNRFDIRHPPFTIRQGCEGNGKEILTIRSEETSPYRAFIATYCGNEWYCRGFLLFVPWHVIGGHVVSGYREFTMGVPPGGCLR